MGKALAHGLEWMDRETRKGVTLYVAGEGGNAIQKRLRAFNLHHGVGPSPDFFMLPESIGLVEASQADDLIEAIQAVGITPTFVVLDTLARTLGPGDENSAEDVGKYISAAGRLQAEFGATVVIVHHNGKNGTYRGSSALLGAVDTMIEVEADGDGVRLVCSKQKDNEAFPPIRLRKVIVPLDVEVTDDTLIDADRLTSLVLVLAPDDEAHEVGDDLIKPRQRKALQALADDPRTWVAWSSWQAITGGAQSTFSKAVGELVASKYVEQKEEGSATYYRPTMSGREVLEGGQANPFGSRPVRDPEPEPEPAQDDGEGGYDSQKAA